MDVAEQALTALAMLSRRHGKAILQAVSACIHLLQIACAYMYMYVPVSCILQSFITVSPKELTQFTVIPVKKKLASHNHVR